MGRKSKSDSIEHLVIKSTTFLRSPGTDTKKISSIASGLR